MSFHWQRYRRVRLVSYHNFDSVQFNVVVFKDTTGQLHKGIELGGKTAFENQCVLSEFELLLLADYLDVVCFAKQSLKYIVGGSGRFTWLSSFTSPAFRLRAGAEGRVVGRIHYGWGGDHFITRVNISANRIKSAANSLRALSAEALV